jgi:methionyl-tRNA formyltransferase
VLADLAAFPPIPQDETQSVYAPKIDKSEARIDWQASAEAIERTVRALAPFPGAWFELPAPHGTERVKLLLAEVAGGAGAPGEVLDAGLTIACGNRALRPLRLQPAGKPAMELAAFLNGRNIAAGTRLS